jgi:hypothetical protein
MKSLAERLDRCELEIAHAIAESRQPHTNGIEPNYHPEPKASFRVVLKFETRD